MTILGEQRSETWLWDAKAGYDVYEPELTVASFPLLKFTPLFVTMAARSWQQDINYRIKCSSTLQLGRRTVVSRDMALRPSALPVQLSGWIADAAEDAVVMPVWLPLAPVETCLVDHLGLIRRQRADWLREESVTLPQAGNAG